MNSIRHTFLGWLATLGLFLLTACGGGGPDNERSGEHMAGAKSPSGEVSRAEVAPSARTIDSLKLGARLNQAELEAIAKTGVLPNPFEGPLLSGAADSTKATLSKAAEPVAETKAAASRVPVYRFYNSGTGAHFFTTSTTERDTVRATMPAFSYEGPAFYTSSIAIPGLSPVHRFYNSSTGVHFYTISEAERANVVATLPQFSYEGIAYYASTLAGTGYTPLYRFFYAARGFHFYTNSAAEKDNIIATLPQYSYEGIGYYVLGSDWQTPAIPHSGITSSQCYQAGSNTLVSCASAGATALNPQQDGHRTAINPMSYSQIISGYFNAFPIVFPLYFPKTDCVRDNVTGLIWEGKAATGVRAGSNLYTQYGDNRPGDASAFVNTVNALSLCGFNDWRLPAADELQSIVDYGVTGGAPKISIGDFPNTFAQPYWASDAKLGEPNAFWRIDFSSGDMASSVASGAHSVRLVRGAAWTGPRYLVTTASYDGDGTNNAVIDRKTGLTWRRCEEGRIWTGSACSGSFPTYFQNQNALAHAATKSGWRLPSVKELGSLIDRARVDPALDSTALTTNLGGSVNWTSSPYVGNPAFTWISLFSDGRVYFNIRGGNNWVRLVQVSD